MGEDRKKNGKRKLSEAELRQRREAAKKSTGPRTPEGKARVSRNAWKHGMRSQAQPLIRQSFAVGAFAKPCRTTCHHHPENPDCATPCTLVVDGITSAGGDCLDKTVYVQAFDAILATIQDRSTEHMHEILAAEAAGAMEVLQRLRAEIAEHGFVMWQPLVNKDGEEIGRKPIGNPALPHYVKLLSEIGINLPELLATPRAAEKLDDQEDAQSAMAQLLGGALSRVGRRMPRTIEHGDD